jgi:KUP system potassium uptake protein
LGVVYGDIGTSPLYALKECFHVLREGGDAAAAATASSLVEPAKAYGIVSLLTWALVLVVAVKYLTFALRADNRGEGGILALLALLTTGGSPGSPGSGGIGESRPPVRLNVILPALIASALLFAEGLITPGISVVSAIEGLQEIVPEISTAVVVAVTVAILLSLFLIQRHGTGRLGRYFGPVTLIWFSSIGLLGLVRIIEHPAVLAACSPHHAVRLAADDPVLLAHLLGSVVLVVTGAEALYADMGHFGRSAIRRAWYLVVMPGLLLNYYGQAAVALHVPGAARNPFWAVVPDAIQIPMIVVATAATIIASQALISGAYSLSQQAMQLGYSPRLNVIHTSHTVRGQIYVPGVNTILMICCITLVLVFQRSSALAAMYGLSVTGTMTITSCLLYLVMRERWKWTRRKAGIALAVFLAVDITFLLSTLTKFTQGGWVALLIGSVVFTVMFTWYRGRQLLARPAYAISMPMKLLLDDLRRNAVVRVPGTAVVMAARPDVVPAVLLHHLKHNQVLHQRVIMLSVQTLPVPLVDDADRLDVRPIGEGFHEVTVRYGFRQSPDVPAALRACKAKGLDVDPDLASFYLGRVTLRLSRPGGMPRWLKRLFRFLYHNEQPVTSFFNLPANRVIELGRQLEL